MTWGIYVSKHDGVLQVHMGDGFETRNESVKNLIEAADRKHGFQEFNSIFFGTDDFKEDNDVFPHANIQVYPAYSPGKDVDLVCPDHMFWNMPPAYDDYEVAVKQIIDAGQAPPETDLMGWRGNTEVHINRYAMITKFRECDQVDFKHVDPHGGCMMSMAQQASRFRYLLDVEGRGYSGRLKMLLFSRRPVFVADRPNKEYYHASLQPWVHYVPVANDLSDLLVNLNRLKNDPELERSIANNAFEFAIQNLTRDAALDRFNFVIQKAIQLQNAQEPPIVAMALYTHNYKPLFDKWFATLPAGFEPIVTFLDTTHRWTHFGFQTDSWYDIIRIKVENTASYLTTQPDGRIALCSDSDIMFVNETDLFSRLAREKFASDPDLDMWIMEESTEGIANGGFYFVRNSKKIRMFLRRMATSCYDKTPLADQNFLNENIRDCLNFQFIPKDYIICGTDIHEPKKSLFMHNVGVGSVQEKLDQQQRVYDSVLRGERLIQPTRWARRGRWKRS